MVMKTSQMLIFEPDLMDRSATITTPKPGIWAGLDYNKEDRGSYFLLQPYERL